MVSRTVRTHKTFIKVTVWYGFVVPQNNYCSNIKDHWSQRTTTNRIIMRNLKYRKNYQMWHRDMKWANGIGKMALIGLLDYVQICERQYVLLKNSRTFKRYSLNNSSFIKTPTPAGLGNCNCVLCFYEFDYYRYLT